MSEMIETCQTALTEILKCRNARRHAAIWERLFCGQWVEALEVARHADISAKSARGLAWTLLDIYRKFPKSNARGRIKKATSAIEQMNIEMERGRDLRGELAPLARRLGLRSKGSQGAVRAREIERALNGEDQEPETVELQIIDEVGAIKGGAIKGGKACSTGPLQYHARDNRGSVQVLSAADPYDRSDALRARAERVGARYPAPSAEQFSGKRSIGLAKPSERAQWIAWIDRVSRAWAGPLYAQDIARMSGAPVAWCAAMYAEWRAHLAEGLDMDARRGAALALGAEIESIAREALAIVELSPDERAKGAALKLALDALDRRARLIGAYEIDLSPKQSVNNQGGAQALAEIGINARALAEIADVASAAMSEREKIK